MLFRSASTAASTRRPGKRSAPLLGRPLRRPASSNLPTVIVDLSELDYMSSRGLRVLTVAKRQADEAAIAIVLASPNEVMSEILAISRYDKLFTITGSAGAKQ